MCVCVCVCMYVWGGDRETPLANVCAVSNLWYVCTYVCVYVWGWVGGTSRLHQSMSVRMVTLGM
jgi:hypothetical protein